MHREWILSNYPRNFSHETKKKKTATVEERGVEPVLELLDFDVDRT
jgi:hypothetical protein